jgi:NAD-dependent DNA ligase
MTTGELDNEELVKASEAEFQKFKTAIRSRDIVMGNQAIKSLKVILDSSANELDFSCLWYDGPIEYQGNHFCFTGKFDYGERELCERSVSKKGGIIEKSVNLRVDYLIIGGEKSPDWVHQNYGRKVERALEIRAKEYRDRPYIVHESDWIKTL